MPSYAHKAVTPSMLHGRLQYPCRSPYRLPRAHTGQICSSSHNPTSHFSHTYLPVCASRPHSPHPTHFLGNTHPHQSITPIYLSYLYISFLCFTTSTTTISSSTSKA